MSERLIDCLPFTCAPIRSGIKPATQARALNWELNLKPFRLKTDVLATEQYQPGRPPILYRGNLRPGREAFALPSRLLHPGKAPRKDRKRIWNLRAWGQWEGPSSRWGSRRGLDYRAAEAGLGSGSSLRPTSLLARQVQQPVDDRGLQGVRAWWAQPREQGAHHPGADPVSALGWGRGSRQRPGGCTVWGENLRKARLAEEAAWSGSGFRTQPASRAWSRQSPQEPPSPPALSPRSMVVVADKTAELYEKTYWASYNIP